MTFWALIGFMLAAMSVIWNDSLQTLSTFIATKSLKFHWKTLATCASFVLVVVVLYGWSHYGGDISYGRLEKIPPIEGGVKYYHALAPGILVALTHFGIPVSTTFLVLSAFASKIVLQKMLVKSVMGYGLSAIFAYVSWSILARFLDEKEPVARPSVRRFWELAQWFSTSFLWYQWLSHDLANIAVFLPRQIPFPLLIPILFYMCGLLFYIFWVKGGRIQDVAKEKTAINYARSGTIIDILYAFVLWFFKGLNSLPMSTTWVFVGLLAGRELAINQFGRKAGLKKVLPGIGKDAAKMTFGLAVSVGLVLAIHYGLTP